MYILALGRFVCYNFAIAESLVIIELMTVNFADGECCMMSQKLSKSHPLFKTKKHR